MTAPAVLDERVRRYLARVPGDQPTPSRLAAASRLALGPVLATDQPGRAVAIDLLAADALITLALLTQARQDPGGLEAFAARMLEEAAAP